MIIDVWPTVPAAVQSLRVLAANQSSVLRVKWDDSVGVVSGYVLSLYNHGGERHAQKQLGSEVNEFTFSGLVPGRLYRAEVLSLSGKLQNKAEAVGRTGETA